jgi:hypothetical protein
MTGVIPWEEPLPMYCEDVPIGMCVKMRDGKPCKCNVCNKKYYAGTCGDKCPEFGCPEYPIKEEETE